jgi:hypothetical protein
MAHSLFHLNQLNFYSFLVADVGTLLAIVVFALAWWRYPGVIHRFLGSKARGMLIFGAVLVAASCVASVWFGEHEFAGYDASPMIDAAWNLMCGHVPPKDFICTFPPICYLPAVLAFHAMGIHWSSLLYATCIACVLACIGGVRALWMVQDTVGAMRWNAALVTYLAMQCVLLLTVNIPWHAPLTAAVNSYLALVTLVLISAERLSRAQRIELWCGYSLASALLILGKPNTAYPAILLSCVCLLGASRSWKPLLAPLAGVALSALFLLPFHMTLGMMVRGYLGLSGRVVPSWNVVFVWVVGSGHRTWGVSVLTCYVVAAFAVVALILVAGKEFRTYGFTWPLLFVAGMAVIAAYGLSTNQDSKYTDIAPLMCAAIVAAMWLRVETAMLSRQFLLTATLMVTATGLLSAVRWRMLICGPWAGPRYGNQVELHDRFFDHLTGRDALAAMLSEVDRAVEQHPGASIMFGGRMEFLYARNQVLPPLHMPIWFDPGSSYPVGSEAAVMQALKDDHPSMILMNKDDGSGKPDMARVPEEMMAYIDKTYRREPGYKSLVVYVLPR